MPRTSRRVLAPPPNIWGSLLLNMPRKLTQEEFLERAKERHGDRYDYSLVEYRGKDSIITIICPKHGPFQQIAGDHIYNGSGCKECANEKLRAERSRSLAEFIKEARRVHGDKYDYSLVNYVNDRTLVDIICPKHGIFQIKPCKHILRGHGCRACGDESLKRPIFGKGINDLRLGTKDPCYHIWHGILARTISDEFKRIHPSYANCSVCDEWLYISNFKKFFDKQYREGYQIDKDILSGRGKKIYSPETCCFVPVEINNLLISARSARGPLPIGVTERCGRYEARINTIGGRVSFGRFRTIEDAFAAYKDGKERYIKEIAQKYYDENKIERRVYDALMNYKVEITD